MAIGTIERSRGTVASEVAPAGESSSPELATLRAAFQHLRAAIERMGAGGFLIEQGLMLVGPQGRIEYATPSLCEILGVPPGSLVGARLPELAVRLGVGELETGTEPFGESGALLSLRRADGSTRILRHQACTLHDRAGARIGTLRTLRDETAAVASSNELAAKSRELDDARARLTRAQHLKALGELSAEVAHEFGNLLQAIGLQAAALRRQGSLPEPVARSVWSIKQAVDIGQALTRRLLTFARDDSEERTEPLDIGRVLRDLVQLLEPRINLSGRTVRMELSLPPLPPVKGNENKLTEAFLNLFLNAMDAMPQGGRLQVSAAERSGEVRVAIRDTGKGMSPDELGRAFDPFFTTKPGGTGLGLSTVYGIVRTHGGSVFAESEPGAGTTVFVSLPTTAPPERLRPAGGTHSPAREAERVLIVDDHPTVREATRELLASQGYEVETASTVAEALAALARRRFAVVVTDVGLPDRPGWEVARAAKERSPTTVVLLVTGWGSHFSLEEARARGADLVFEKPVDPDVLLATVSREAGRH
jgi:signal transduction histidine kinase